MSRKSSHSEMENTCKRDAGKIERSSSLTSKKQKHFCFGKHSNQDLFYGKDSTFPKG